MWFMKKKEKRKRKYTKSDSAGKIYSKDEKLKLLKEFEQIGAPITMFCKWYGMGVGTFKSWQDRYKLHGEDGLEDNRGGREPELVPDVVKAEIIKLKTENPGMGVKKISDFLLRNKFVKVNRDNVEKTLKEDPATKDLVQKKRLCYGNSSKEPIRFERSKPGELYQMDIMTFHLRGLYKIYVIACLDDYSRFVVSIGIFRSQTTDRVLDVVKSAIEKYGMPKEILTDNGRQFYTWRGRSEFQKYLQKSGIRHIRSRPYHPQTCGKVESLWRNMYQELLSKEPIASFEEMQDKVAKWVEWYNYKRPHQGIDGLTPSDRFFNVADGVREMMKKGSAMVKESFETDPRKIQEPTYLVGKIGGREIRVIAKEGSVMLEGLNAVEENIENKGVKENGTGKNEDRNVGSGIVEVPQGDPIRGEVSGSAACDGEGKEGETGLRGDGCIEGDVPGMEENSVGGHSQGVPEDGEARPEAEELREGRKPEGINGKGAGGPEKAGGKDPDPGGRKEKSDAGTADSQESNEFL